MARSSRGPVRAGAVGLMLLVLSGLLVVPTAAAPGPVTSKPHASGVAALRAEVARTSKQLADDTAAWQRGQVQLGIQVQRKVEADRALEALQTQAVDAEDQLASLANALYRNPVNPSLTATLAGDARLLIDTIFLRRHLNQDQESLRVSTDLLATQAARAEELLAQHQSAALAVTRLQSQLDAQLTRLQAQAVDSATRLQRLLDQMRAQEAARLTAARGAASCSGAVPAVVVNGFLPASALCRLRTAPGHRLAAPAASAFDAMSTAFAADNGAYLCVTDSYRDYAGQVDVFRRKPSLAATPGRSQHGWGLAVDLCGGVQRFGSPAFNWMEARAAGYGFVHPDWAEPDGSRPEPWHWEFRG